MKRDLIPTIEDLPTNKANCATCTRKGGDCARNKDIKNHQHNGLLYGLNGDIVGMIVRCVNYTGPFSKSKEASQLKLF